MEAVGVVEEAEEWSKAAATSAEGATTGEQAQREAAGVSRVAETFVEKKQTSYDTTREEKIRRAKMLVRESTHWHALV